MSEIFQREPASQALFQEALPLLFSHYKELYDFQDIALDPDFEKYLAIEASGSLRVFTARSEGELIGYVFFVVSKSIHFRESLQALADALYLDASYRGKGLGKRFIDWCDEELRKEGVELVYHHTKANQNFGPLLEKLSYKLAELVYARRLN